MQIQTAKITLEQYFTPEEYVFVKEQYNQDKVEYEKSASLMKQSQAIPFPEFNVWVKGVVRDKELGKIHKLSLSDTVALRKIWSSENASPVKHFAEWLKEQKSEYDKIKVDAGIEKQSLPSFVAQKNIAKNVVEKQAVTPVTKSTVKFMDDKTLGISNKGLVYGALFLGVVYLGYRIWIKNN